MIMFRERPVSIVVLCAILLHLLWATLIQIDSASLNATGLSAVYRYIYSPGVTSFILYVVAVLAGLGLFTRFPWIVLLLIPQEAVLLMSAAGATKAMWLGQFADGVARAHTFIIADQAYCLILAAGHTFAIIAHARRVIRDRY